LAPFFALMQELLKAFPALSATRLLAECCASRDTGGCSRLTALDRAFVVVGGVSREVLFNQLIAVIGEDHRGTGERLLENSELARLAAHWGSRIRACQPHRAQTKDKVEQPICYLRANLVNSRTFLGDGDPPAPTFTWLETVANMRVHGASREAPRERSGAGLHGAVPFGERGKYLGHVTSRRPCFQQTTAQNVRMNAPAEALNEHFQFVAQPGTATTQRIHHA
jgi:hypothetical protein